MYGQMDKAPYARRQQTCAHLSVCSSGLSFVTQKAAEMKGRKGRIVSLRNIHVRTPEVLLVLSLYIYIYIYASFYYTINPLQDYMYNLCIRN